MSEEALDDTFLAETLLEFFKRAQVVVDTGTFDCLANFQSDTCLPVVFACVLLLLIARSIIHKPNLFTLKVQQIILIQLPILSYFVERCSQRLDTMLELKFGLDDLLIKHISLFVFDYE